MIRILIVDDSPTVVRLLQHIFEQEPDMKVVGTACNGLDGVQKTLALRPDLVTMDIRMPVLNGFEATKEIMAIAPTPIVVISASIEDEDLRIFFHAIEAGALTVIEKPKGLNLFAFEDIHSELVSTLRIMAEVKVVTHRKRMPKKFLEPDVPKKLIGESSLAHYRLVAIGGSTGAPAALKMILQGLPADFPVPIVIVQHMVEGFIGGMATWLNTHTAINVKMAASDEILLPGVAYCAPDHYHLEVQCRSGELQAYFSLADKVEGFRPSASILFDSIARALPCSAVGLVLTGMGSDGAEGLQAMKTARCHTLVQDQSSAVVYGMPGSALAIGAVDQVVVLDELADYLCSLVF